MRILGIQKTTLIDYPDKIACTIFLYGCNFRCGFCHNPGLVLEPKGKELSQKEILTFLNSRTKYLEAVCFTGGEPLLTLEKEFVREIKNLGYLIKIDTNGSFPNRLKEFIDEGLVDFIAMDIKGPKEDYEYITAVKVNLEKIEESIKLIHSFGNYEFRTTIVPSLHPIENVFQMIKWVNTITGEKIKRFALQGFKKEEELLNKEFLKEHDTTEEYLLKIKERIKDFVEEIEIKV